MTCKDEDGIRRVQRNVTVFFCLRNMNLFVSFSHGRSHRPAHVRKPLSQIPSDPAPKFPTLTLPPTKNSTTSMAARSPSHYPPPTQNPSLHHRGLTLHRFIMLKSTSSMIPRSPQTSRSETGSVCSSWRRGQLCDCWGGGGQGSVSVVVLNHETG